MTVRFERQGLNISFHLSLLTKRSSLRSGSRSCSMMWAFSDHWGSRYGFRSRLSGSWSLIDEHAVGAVLWAEKIGRTADLDYKLFLIATTYYSYLFHSRINLDLELLSESRSPKGYRSRGSGLASFEEKTPERRTRTLHVRGSLRRPFQ